MSSLGSPSPFLIAGKKSYTVGRSLRFNDGDSPWLQRTVSSSSNRRTFTISVWVKRSTLGSGNIFGQTDTSGSYMFYIVFDSSNKLYILDYDYPSNNYHFVTNRKFRDTTAWYHIVLAVDTTQATNTNRSKLYVNGVQETSFSTANYPSQNLQTFVNHTTYPVRIGRNGWSHTTYFDGYMAEYNFIDGLQYDASYFGETDATTGQWIPKEYTGSYGTNGFYLKFADNSGTTATTLGKDLSGNGNNLTPNNFSVSAGEGNDSLEDTPTNNYPTLNPLDFGGDSSNYQVLSNGNLQVKAQSSVWSSTRGTFHVKTGKWYWEVKIVSAASLRPFIGIIESDVRLASNQTEQSNELGATSTGIVYWGLDRIRGGANTSGYTSNVPSLSAGDIVGVALDMDNKKVFFSKNGTFFASQDPANSSGELVAFSNSMQTATIAPAIQTYNNTSEAAMNFGQRPFDYTPPTGYKKLNSSNLPSPTILDPTKYFDTLLYSGTGSSQNITGLQFRPDWVWIKSRSNTNFHNVYDTLRLFSDGTKERIYPNSNQAGESSTYSGTTNLTAFNSNGFTVNNGTDTNGNGPAWNWDAGETDSKTYTVTVVSDSGNKYRFDGFGTSAVTLDLAEGGTYTFNYPSAHPLRFSTTSDGTHGGGSEYTTGVSSYGNSVTITVAASAPTLYYYCTQHSGMGGQVNTNTTLGSSNFDGALQSTVKVNSTSGFSIVTYTGNGGTGTTVGHGLSVTPDLIIIKSRGTSDGWAVYHSSLGATKYLALDGTDTVTTSSSTWGNTSPTSSVFRVNSSSRVNSSTNHVAYCFNEVAGYSKFGKYTGTGIADGAFVFTGFRPAFIMYKRTDTTDDWGMHDNKRDPFNQVRRFLYPNATYAEWTGGTNDHFDFLSNGFKVRNTGTMLNAAGGTYVYLAFAEAPFKFARAR